jgi:hypothetical protein
MTKHRNPIDVVQDWQHTYKTTHGITDMNDSDALMLKAKNYFADTISEFSTELSGAQLHAALISAAEENLSVAEKEYKFAKEFVELLKGKKVKTTAKTANTKSYPSYVCNACGTKYGAWYQRGGVADHIFTKHCATFHIGTCGVCQTKGVPVTEPRDYGHLVDGWKTHASKKVS